ncbi:MAG: LacI family DNA-binding transcriptional regulator [Fimbriimonadaceae bacterium]|nr:LacI family DNA-binding transcriptional regulator [Fimbriimonadaceae bacterium]QYK55519.1 MAG: LacI family DNA-binding transcriptional regulator [Fimbriimonadaceae bacterium]
MTLADVARLAGVSVQTVSQVLAGTPQARIAEKTRAKVAEAAQQLEYRPNRLAQAMRQGKTYVISVWTHLEVPCPAAIDALCEIARVVRLDGYELMVHEIRPQRTGESSFRLPRFPADGAFWLSMGDPDCLLESQPFCSDVPAVILGYSEGGKSDAVFWDLTGALRHLLVQVAGDGISEVCHIGRRRKEYSRTTFEAVASELGLCPRWLEPEDESGMPSIQELTAFLDGSPTPKAVFCTSMNAALVVERKLLSLGVKLPQQCQVWAYYSSCEGLASGPPVSLAAVPVPEAVELAWQMLRERMEGSDAEPRAVLLPMPLVACE